MKNAVEAKNITCVFHFTCASNLCSILKHGLYPRDLMQALPIVPDINDYCRFDREYGAVSCSIGFPNYKMFYGLRCKDTQKTWVVLCIKPDIIWEKDCAFCKENAASKNVSCIPIQKRKGLVAFNSMFDDFNGKPNRKQIGIPENCPTNPQAEILVFSIIEPEYIFGVICDKKETEQSLKTRFPNFSFYSKPDFFKPRFDYKHWE